MVNFKNISKHLKLISCIKSKKSTSVKEKDNSFRKYLSLTAKYCSGAKNAVMTERCMNNRTFVNKPFAVQMQAMWKMEGNKSTK